MDIFDGVKALSTSWTLRAAISQLDRRARHRSVGAEHTAIALPGFETLTAIPAIKEELAGVGRHRFDRPMIAMRTGQDRFQ
jgi:hypothetical protein